MDLGGTTAILKAIATAVQPIPVAGNVLTVLLRLAVDICEAAERAVSNRESYRQLAADVARYASAVARAVNSNMQFSMKLPGDDDTLTDEWVASIKRLNDVFSEALSMIVDRCKEDERRKGKSNMITNLRCTWYAIRHSKADKDGIDNIRSKLETGLQVFQIDTTVHHHYASERIQDILMTIDHRGAKLLSIAELNHLEQKLAPTNNARFDGEGQPNGCLPNTRVEVLRTIRTWATNHTGASSAVFCLSGMAGTGKTTIAREICIMFDRFSLGASFFISRSATDKRSAQNIIQTIVYQLAIQQQEVSCAVIKALQSTRDVTTRPLAEQVEGLLTKSLEAWKNENSPLLLVIDALDECDMDSGCEGGDLLPLLVSAVRRLSGHVRLLITTREEPGIMRTIKELGLNSDLSSIRLHHIDDSVVRNDIVLYYSHHLKRIAAKASLGPSWPSKADFDLLVSRTGKLFVFAALVIRLLDGEWSDPEDQLHQILHSSSSLAAETAHKGLDELYMNILKKASSQDGAISDNLMKKVRELVGTLLLLQSPQLSETIANLLGVKLLLIKEGVSRLSAVLLVMNDECTPATIFHPSFADFILTRCLDDQFRVDPLTHHAYLAYRCLVVMNNHLKRDICEIRDPSLMNKDLKDLSQRCNNRVPLELRYACENWITHLTKANHAEEELREELKMFCEQHLLHWVEALSLLGKVSRGQQGLPSAISWCKEHISSEHNIITLLDDLERTVNTYDVAIVAGALQVYCTALLFMPTCKLYRRAHEDESSCVSSLQLVSRRLDRWVALRRNMRGHTGAVTSIAFSPEGTHIVSGSLDRAIRVWDSATGIVLMELKGHTGEVSSVVFSPDGACIASSSSDKTIRIWDSATGANTATLEGHTDWVQSIAFSSPDGTRIASGSDDNTVRVWDSATGATLATFEGHARGVQSVAFSFDGTRIASGSSDNTVLVWDSATGAIIATLEGHTDWVRSVAFSPDGIRIASGSSDNSVRIWDSDTGVTLATLEGHTNWVRSVAFSLDGTRIVSGSFDKTVRVWSSITGALLATFEGHTDWVQSVAFSPDKIHIASGSSDQTARVWDFTVGATPPTLTGGHSDCVRSVAFSPDGGYIASGSEDTTVHVWDTTTGEIVATLEGQACAVWSVAYSPDGTRIASGSDDGTVCWWDLATGGEFPPLKGHTDRVWSVAFSPDKTCIASGSEDHTVRVWDLSNGNNFATLNHGQEVHAVAFSPDSTQIAVGLNHKLVWVWDFITGGTRYFGEDINHPTLVWVDRATFSSSMSSSASWPVISFDEQSGWLYIFIANPTGAATILSCLTL